VSLAVMASTIIS